MDYIQIDYEKIKGFTKLTKDHQILFKFIYQNHNSCLGLSIKNNWLPIKIEKKLTHFKVYFNNNEWLHYHFNGRWY